MNSFVGACIAVAGIVAQKLFDDTDTTTTEYGQFELAIARQFAGSDKAVQRAVDVAAQILTNNVPVVHAVRVELEKGGLICRGRLTELLAPVITHRPDLVGLAS